MNPSRSLRRGFPAVEGKRNVVSRKEASVERSLRRALDRIRHSLSPLKGFALPLALWRGKERAKWSRWGSPFRRGKAFRGPRLEGS